MLVSINRTVSAESFWEQARQCAWVGRNSCSVFCRLSLITRAASVALEAACLPVVRVGDGRERRGVPGKFARTRCAGSREALGQFTNPSLKGKSLNNSMLAFSKIAVCKGGEPQEQL